MKALIYNSGLGKRMGELTKDKPKSMVELKNGETIFHRQLRLLRECGIKDVVVTTGPFKEKIESVTKAKEFSDMNFTLVENEIYDKTNYIYSMYKASKYLDDDFILLHGDLVFNRELLLKVLNSKENDLITINRLKELPEKDFKGRIIDGKLEEVSINIFDDNCYALQPMYKASEYLDDDFILLHGDLVFNKGLLLKVLKSKENDLITINRKKELPEKDFKGRIIDGKLEEVSINIFDDNCFALQPMYKLSKETLSKWVEKTKEFVESGNTGVYAENAFNTILPNLNVKEFSYENDFIDEVDNPSDLERVSNEIRLFDFREQSVFKNTSNLLNIINSEKVNKLFVVCDKVMFDVWPLKKLLESNNISYILFSDFTANPKFDDIVKGIELFNKENCDFIVSIGGGSSIDTAKIIKLYSVLDYKKGITKDYKYNPVKHLAIPTTAGTGSESTRYSVCYYEGKKQSITHDSIVPDYVILDPSYLLNLPYYQKVSTLMDALCQGIESYWSVNSTDESKEYSKESIKLILNNVYKYIENNDLIISENMLHASNLAGKAINITQTTAAHAMSYKLTSMYNIAHGHAVSVTLPYLWKFMEENLNECIDSRGKDYLKNTLSELKDMVGGYNKIIELFNYFKLTIPSVSEEELNILVNSVNPDRLKNNPEKLTNESIKNIYIKSLKM